MRRPVKPFVTEYRGSTRRQPGQGLSSKTDSLKPDPMKLEPDAPEPRAPAPAWPQQPAAPEDGYEAALRAADALFSGGRDAPPSESTEAPATASGPAAPGGGRVLRSLEEPQSEEMLRLEAEFAPKKRGRKPGSKNKPKPPVPASAAETAADERSADADAADADTEGAVGALPVRSPAAGEAHELPAARGFGALQAVTATRVAALAAGAGEPRGERYAWVRTRLKPGEQWKRRLPKVAW